MEQDLYVYLDNYEVPPRIAMVQKDTDRVLCIHPMDFEFHVGYTATIYFERENGTLYHIDATTISGNVAKFDASQLITSAGNVYAQMVVTTPTGDVSSFAFIVHVQKSAKGTPQTPEEGLTFDEYLNRSEEAAERAETAAEQAEGLIGNVAYVEALAENNDRRISNIEELLDGYDYTTDIQMEIAYQRDVPEKALKNAVVAMVGGMSRRGFNKLPNVIESKTENGISLTKNADGTYTANGTSTAQVDFNINVDSPKLPNGTYYVRFGADASGCSIRMPASYNLTQPLSGASFVVSDASSNPMTVLFRVASGVTLNNVVIYPMINEGSTPLPFEPYTEELLSSNLEKIESRGANLLDYKDNGGGFTEHMELPIGTYYLSRFFLTASTQINTRPMYFNGTDWAYLNTIGSHDNGGIVVADGTLGWGESHMKITLSKPYTFRVYYNNDVNIVMTKGGYVTEQIPYRGTIGSKPFPSEVASQMHGINDSVYDEVNLISTVYPNMKEIDLGTLNYGIQSGASNTFYASISDRAYSASVNALCADYAVVPYTQDISGMADKTIRLSNASATIFIKNSECSTVAEIKQAMSGVILHYEAVEGGTDYEAILYVKRSAKKVFNSNDSWTKTALHASGTYGFLLDIGDMKPSSDASVPANLVSDSYVTYSGSRVYIDTDGISNWSTAKRICIRDFTKNDFTDTQFGNSMIGKSIIYELAIPQILDVTEYFEPFGNSLEVEGGGSIITRNADDTYKVGIPMTMAYMISLKGEN